MSGSIGGTNFGHMTSLSSQPVETTPGGAVRDMNANKIRPDLISPFMMTRLGEWLRQGVSKYNARNWEKGMPFSVAWASLMRHVVKFAIGWKDEDHLSAIIFNAMVIIHYQEVGRMDLDDMPKYVMPYATSMESPSVTGSQYEIAYAATIANEEKKKLKEIADVMAKEENHKAAFQEIADMINKKHSKPAYLHPYEDPKIWMKPYDKDRDNPFTTETEK